MLAANLVLEDLRMGNEKLLTVPEFAEALNITPAAVRRWILQRKILFTKIGARLIRIPSSEAQRIIEEGLRPARREYR